MKINKSYIYLHCDKIIRISAEKPFKEKPILTPSTWLKSVFSMKNKFPTNEKHMSYRVGNIKFLI